MEGTKNGWPYKATRRALCESSLSTLVAQRQHSARLSRPNGVRCSESRKGLLRQLASGEQRVSPRLARGETAIQNFDSGFRNHRHVKPYSRIASHSASGKTAKNDSMTFARRPR